MGSVPVLTAWSYRWRAPPATPWCGERGGRRGLPVSHPPAPQSHSRPVNIPRMKSPFVAKLSLIVVAAALVLAAPFARAAERISGDSLVLVAEKPAMLLGDEIDPATVTVRSTYLADAPGSITYERGRD